MKAGDIYRTSDQKTELEIVDINDVTDRVTYYLRDQNGIEYSSADRIDIITMILNLDLVDMTEATGNTCWHTKKEKKWLLTTCYWKCTKCGKEFDNER